MNELWRDYSAHQDNPDTVRLISPQVAIDNGVVGFIFRSGTSWTYKDPTFNYLYPLVEGSYRTSYHNFSPGADPDNQIDNWLEQHPAMDVLPRFAAVEGNYNDLEPYQIAATFYDFSETYKARVGQRCGIYTRKQLADLWLTPYLDEDWLNEHWWWIAQYDARRDTEQLDRVIIPPNGVLLERCWLKQTADQMVGFPGEAESGYVDRDRFQFENMDEWISTNFGGDITNPDTPIDCCEELVKDVAMNALLIHDNKNDIDTLWEAGNNSDIYLNKLDNDIKYLRLEAMAGIDGNQQGIEQNVSACRTNEGLLQEAININLDNIDSLQSLISTNSLGIAELARRLDNLQQGQLELAENGLGYEDKLEELLKDHDYDMDVIDARIEKVLDVVATHSHLEPVGGTFWQRLRWLVTGKTEV